VVPSLPGHGFSGKPTETGWDPIRIARAWVTLMKRLGYTQYVAQGGDWGNAVTEQMALLKPEGLLGIHANMPATVPHEVSKALATGGPKPDGLAADEDQAYEILKHFFATGVGYATEMANRPQTLYGIADSPVGLAAWMLDHDERSCQLIARAFAGQAGGLSRDDVLDDVTHYWLTNTAVSSARLYWESHLAFFDVKGVEIPVGVTAFPDEALSGSTELGGEGVSLRQGRRRQPLRRVGAAADLLRTDPGDLQVTALAMEGSAAADLPIAGEFPELDGATTWLNSERLTPSALRGKVIVVQFCTFSCVNWLRTLPYVRAWAERYRDDGLVVIGAHSPEFPFEHEVEKVQHALEGMGIEYPIAMDNDFAVWSAFGNQAWPALYFIDAQGRIRHHHFGEEDYERSERVIQQLLAEAGHDVRDTKLVSVEPGGVELAADWNTVASPETYVGCARATGLASPGGVEPDRRRLYTEPPRLELNQWALSGDLTVGEQITTLNEPGGRITFRFHARDLNLVLGRQSEGGPLRFLVLIDASRQKAPKASTSTRGETALWPTHGSTS
jgi:pimeloyl-ACP methyl ester carboxylesterase